MDPVSCEAQKKAPAAACASESYSNQILKARLQRLQRSMDAIAGAGEDSSATERAGVDSQHTGGFAVALRGCIARKRTVK